MKNKKIVWILTLCLCILLSAVSMIVFATELPVGEYASETLGTLDVYRCNLSFRSNICIKYAVDTQDENVKLLIWQGERSNHPSYTLDTADLVLSPVAKDTVEGKPCVIFDYTELSAKQMTDVVYARAYVEVDGTVQYGNVKKYSILQYAYNKLGYTDIASDSAELKQMLTDMLSYGASAQKYFENYHIERLATDPFYQITVQGGVLPDNCNEGLYRPGTTLSLTASDTDDEGDTFAHWVDADGKVISTDKQISVTIGEANTVYTAVYSSQPMTELFAGLILKKSLILRNLRSQSPHLHKLEQSLFTREIPKPSGTPEIRPNTS